jgi:hypothetical protein
MTVLQMVDDVIEALIHIVIADDFGYEIVKRVNNFGVHAFRLHVMFRLSVWSRQIATLATLLPRLSPLARTMADSLLLQRNDYHRGYSQKSRRAPLFVFEFEEALFAFTYTTPLFAFVLLPERLTARPVGDIHLLGAKVRIFPKNRAAYAAKMRGSSLLRALPLRFFALSSQRQSVISH